MRPDAGKVTKQQSVDLYDRDDTIDALWQQQIALACSEGWRPSRPISRGGQAPTLEASFQVPSQPDVRLYISRVPCQVDRELQQLNLLEKPDKEVEQEPAEPPGKPSAALAATAFSTRFTG